MHTCHINDKTCRVFLYQSFRYDVFEIIDAHSYIRMERLKDTENTLEISEVIPSNFSLCNLYDNIEKTARTGCKYINKQSTKRRKEKWVSIIFASIATKFVQFPLEIGEIDV